MVLEEVIGMDALEREIEEWKKWLVENLQETIKTEIEKDVEVLLDCLLEKRLLKER